MKTRHGFVSNSSSSSFIVAVKKTEKESFRDALYRVFRPSFEIPQDHPLRSLIDPDRVIEAICDSTDDETDKKTIIEDYLTDSRQPFGIDDEKVLDFIKFMSGSDGFVRIGGFSSEEQGLEATLCDAAIKLVIEKNGEILGVLFQEGGY